MKRTILPRAFLPCLLLAALSHASLSPTQAQTTAAPSNPLPQTSDKQSDTAMAPLLQHIVHLHLGSVTVQQAVSAIATQSGLRIYCEEYLQNRKLIVQMEGVTAQTDLSPSAPPRLPVLKNPIPAQVRNAIIGLR